MKLRHALAILLTALWYVLSPLYATTAFAANVCVTGATPAGGSCTSTVADLATAITNAVDGDTIYLHAGTTYSGHWTLPNKGVLTTGITIRSDADDANLPATGVRLDPSYASFLPKLQGDNASAATITAAFSSNHYTLKFLEFLGNPNGNAEMVRIGDNTCVAVSPCQEFASQQPDHYTVDRVYMHGDPIVGQKRGITLGATNVTIVNSTIIELAGLGQDSQAIGGANGYGPYNIENNTLSATTETILFGGDDPAMETAMDVTGSPTTTSASVTVRAGRVSTNTHNLSELHVGQLIAIQVTVGATAERRYSTIRSITGSGTTGSLTFDAIDTVPDVPGEIKGGVVASGITIKNNYFYKPTKWLLPIVDQGTSGSGTPTAVSATPSTSSGSLAAGTYYYYVYGANFASYGGGVIRSNPSLVATATLSGTGKITINWTRSASSAITYYLIERGTSTTTASHWWKVDGSLATFTDDGTSAGVTSLTNGTSTAFDKAAYWQLKNLFEIKAAQNVTMSGNVLENQWNGSDIGYAFWVKSVDQGGHCPYCQSRDITIEKNIIRHVDGFMELSAVEYTSGVKSQAPPPLTNVTVRNNLVYDSGSAWALTKGTTGTAAYALSISSYPVMTNGIGSENIQIYHNTIVHTTRGAITFGGSHHDNLTIRDNLFRHESYGVLGTSGQSEGSNTLNFYGQSASGTNNYSFTHNAIAGANASLYPASNYGPTVANWESYFANYTANGASNSNGAADYHLLNPLSDGTTTNPYHNAATDGTDIGADIDAVTTATATAISGAAAAATPPVINTTSLPGGTVSTAYSQTISASGTGTLSFAVTSGSLPTSLSLGSSTGVVSGTPTVAGTYSFTVTVTDATTTLTAAQSYSVTIAAVYVSPTFTTSSPLTAGTVGSPYTKTIVVGNGTAPMTWSVTSGTLPTGLTLDSASGIISGTPTAAVAATFTIQVVDSHPTTISTSYSLTINAESLPAGRPITQGAIPQQFASFVGTSAPTLSTSRCCVIGDEWMDTSTNPPTLKIATDVTGSVTWAAQTSTPSTHNLLSTQHADTVADTPQSGDLITGTSSNKWGRLPIGSPNLVLSSTDGTAIGWAPLDASQISTGTLPFARMPTGAVQFDVTILTPTSAYTGWGTLLSGTVEFLGGTGRNRDVVDLTNYTQARLYVRTGSAGGNAGSRLRAEYSADGGSTWTPLDGGTGPSVDFNFTNTYALSPWVAISAAAKSAGDVIIRLAATGGDGTSSPAMGSVHLQFR